MDTPVGRRAFLRRAWKWGFGLLGLAGAWTTWDIFKPGNAEGFGGVVRVGERAAVPATGVTEITAIRGYVAEIEGEVVALSWKCPHLGCKVPWCDSSAEFECPCHGSKFNRLGEWREGPAPRGMDRYAVQIDDGSILVDTAGVTLGPPHGPETIEEPLQGPKCGGTETT